MDRPFEQVLVPLDGSGAAERALTPALELVRRTGVPLRLLSRALPGEKEQLAGYLADLADRHAAVTDVETELVDVESIPDAIADLTFPFFRRRGAGREPSELPGTAWVLAERAPELGDEVEALLGGRLVEHLAGRGRPVPAWAVLNKVAHASARELADPAGPRGNGDLAPGERLPCWQRAERAVAAEVVDAATARGGLAELQQRVLVPLLERVPQQLVQP